MRCGQPSRSTIGLAEMATKKAKVVVSLIS